MAVLGKLAKGAAIGSGARTYVDAQDLLAARADLRALQEGAAPELLALIAEAELELDEVDPSPERPSVEPARN